MSVSFDLVLMGLLVVVAVYSLGYVHSWAWHTAKLRVTKKFFDGASHSSGKEGAA